MSDSNEFERENDANDLESMDGAEEYEPLIIELDDERFEIIDALTYEDVNYLALIPYEEDDFDEDEDEEYEMDFIVLKEVEEDGECYLSTIDDDELSDKIGNMFIAHFEECEKNFD